MTHQLLSKDGLRRKIQNILFSQGYGLQNNTFLLHSIDTENIRKIHNIPRAEKIKKNICFIEDFTPKAKEFMRNSSEIDVNSIKPRLIQIKADTLYADLFNVVELNLVEFAL